MKRVLDAWALRAVRRSERIFSAELPKPEIVEAATGVEVIDLR